MFQKSETQDRIQTEIRALKKYIENNLHKVVEDLPDPNVEDIEVPVPGENKASGASNSNDASTSTEQQNKPEEAFGFDSNL